MTSRIAASVPQALAATTATTFVLPLLPLPCYGDGELDVGFALVLGSVVVVDTVVIEALLDAVVVG